jgi:hypothetical protein
MLRFAPRYGRVSPCLVRPVQVRARAVIRRAANDNGDRATPLHWGEDGAMLEAALRLFAAHGISAAQRAADEAEIARTGGDIDKARWWIGVCRTLDRRVAGRINHG